jgi:hypothetical protein
MKHALFFFLVSLVASGLQAQKNEFNEIYDAFRGEEGVVSLYVPGFLCRLAAHVPDLEREEQALLRSIKSIRLMVIENPEINRQVNLAKVLSHVDRDPGVVPLLTVHDDDEDVLILARQEKEIVSELYVIVGGSENVMIRIRGRMDRDLMKCLYDVTGIEETRLTRKI